MAWRLATRAKTRNFMKQARLRKNAERRLLEGKLSTVFVAAFALAMVATLVLLVWQKSTRPLDIADYEGRIVDRWGDYAELEEGSRPRFRLVVESEDGKRFTVKVDANVYESARLGMRIKSKAGQIVLIDSEQRTTGGK
jgi:hypothetical protein